MDQISENTAEDDALLALLQWVKRRGYQFVAPTPATHARVLRRKHMGQNVRDVLGWSLPFARATIDADLLALLERGGVLAEHSLGLISRARVSTCEGACFLHSAYPTRAADSVFFGPDSYRFARFIAANLSMTSGATHAVDVGTGAGIGAMMLARVPNLHVAATDINPQALRYAALNLHAAGNRAALQLSNGLEAVADPIDLIVCNPPYIADPEHRIYRDGGAMQGAQVALEWARQARMRLKPGGVLLLYTGVAVGDGGEGLEARLRAALDGFAVTYTEIDPDVFGEELERPVYQDVERIAAVGVVAVKN